MDSVRIMLTGNADQKTAIEAVNLGHVFQFLTKPCPQEMLLGALQNAFRQHQLIVAEKELLENTVKGSVKILTETLSMVDPDSFGRGQKLKDLYLDLAAACHWPVSWDIELAAMLSPLGRLTVPAEVWARLRQGLALRGQEQDVVARVPEIGASLLENIPRLEAVANIVRYHRKHYDGSGLPLDAMHGDQLPFSSRVLKILGDLLDGEEGGQRRVEVLASMRQTKGIYDPELLESVCGHFQALPGQWADASEGGDDEIIEFAQLRAGHVLRDQIVTLDGVLIAPAGLVITPPVLEKLRNFSLLQGIREPIRVQAA